MSVRGELVEMLAKALSRAERGANDRGVLNRIRDVGDDFMDPGSTGYNRGGIFPKRFSQIGNDMGVARRSDWRSSGFPQHNWNLTSEEQSNLDALGPLSRARFLAESGEARAISPYERTLLRRNNPTEASRLMWGMEDEPRLLFAPETDFSDFAGLSRPNGELASPEEFLGRPLTPDHIWNDPRFQERMERTRDLDGIRTPEERFRIAAEREQMAQSGPRGVASARWGVDNPVVKILLLGGAGLGGGMTLREVLANRMSA